MRQVKITFHNISLIVFGVLTIVNILNCSCFKYNAILLNENQILYIYSALAQVIGALLGLTIAGYSVIDEKIHSVGLEDKSIAEYTEKLRYDYFNALVYIVIFSIVDIIFCIITLAIYSCALIVLLSFFLTESILLFLLIMAEVIRFVLYLSPSTLKIKGSQEKHSIESEYNQNDDSNSDIVYNYTTFITKYISLEQLISVFACELVQRTQDINKLQNSEALDILLQKGIINGKSYNLLNMLRRYRNALAHGFEGDKYVNPIINKRLEDMYRLINDIYVYRNSERFQEKINKLYEYTDKYGTNETQKKIIEYLNKHPQSSSSEISEHIGHSKATIVRNLKLLQESGLVKNVGAGKSNRWTTF
jgi:uncharacterized protein YutE (UPF0331/DUF86 family)